MEGFISVIVPVYNVERYLSQCLDSILGQDYEKLEVILIDDGSTDASGGICDAYAARDGRIRVIHQKNSGGAAAKNAGLRIATGEYLSFVDSDDYLEPGAYSYMLSVIQSHQADAAMFAFREVWQDHAEDRVFYQGTELVDNMTYLRRLPKDYSCALLWNKLYKRELYEGVFFEEGRKIDDEYFTYQGFLKDRRIVFDDRIIYNYRRRASSVMGSRESARQRLMDRLDSIEKRRDVVVRCRPELKRLYDETYLDALWYLSEDRANTAETAGLMQSKLKTYLKTKGNAFPPRYLWGYLTKLYFEAPKKRVERCAAVPAAESVGTCFP